MRYKQRTASVDRSDVACVKSGSSTCHVNEETGYRFLACAIGKPLQWHVGMSTAVPHAADRLGWLHEQDSSMRAACNTPCMGSTLSASGCVHMLCCIQPGSTQPVGDAGFRYLPLVAVGSKVAWPAAGSFQLHARFHGCCPEAVMSSPHRSMHLHAMHTHAQMHACLPCMAACRSSRRSPPWCRTTVFGCATSLGLATTTCTR